MVSPVIAWVLLGIASLGAFYFLIGYPLLLWKLPPPVRPVAKRMGHEPPVSILIAVYNGEAFLAEKLESLLELEYPADKREILVLSDGSTDRTNEIARAYGYRGVRLVELERGGKASALNAGVAAATGAILFFTDVRQKLHPAALRHLAANFADPEVGAVTGELKILRPNADNNEQGDMDLYWRYELWVRGLHSGAGSLFNTTGCIYAMRAELARPLPLNCLGDDAELPLNAYRAGYRIVFDAESIAYDYATAGGTEWRRRMRTLGGMWQIVRWHPEVFFTPRRMTLHFVSHKLGRLLLPWLLLLGSVATWLLPAGPARWALVAGEVVFCGLVAVDWVLGPQAAAKRLTSRARTFAVMNFASLLSVRSFFGGPPAMWTPTRVERVEGQR